MNYWKLIWCLKPLLCITIYDLISTKWFISKYSNRLHYSKKLFIRYWNLLVDDHHPTDVSNDTSHQMFCRLMRYAICLFYFRLCFRHVCGFTVHSIRFWNFVAPHTFYSSLKFTRKSVNRTESQPSSTLIWHGEKRCAHETKNNACFTRIIMDALININIVSFYIFCLFFRVVMFDSFSASKQ